MKRRCDGQNGRKIWTVNFASSGLQTIRDQTIKKDGLIIICGGQDIADIDDSMPDLTTEGDEDAYSLHVNSKA